MTRKQPPDTDRQLARAGNAQQAAGTPAQDDLKPLQLFFLAGAVFAVSAGYGALLPMLPGWLSQQVPGMSASDIAQHVGFLSAAYTAGVLIGAPIWGLISDRLGRPQILIGGLIGYVASLLLLLPSMEGLWAIYVLRVAAGVFIAAVVPVVSALVAAHTPRALRARRFAWLGAASLLGFLFGPGLNATADFLASLITDSVLQAQLSAQFVILLSAMLGATMLLGLSVMLPAHENPQDSVEAAIDARSRIGVVALWWLGAAIMFVLSGFEIGIVLHGGQEANLSTQEVAMMFALCSLVMLGVNALLFFTALLDKVAPRLVMAIGSIIGMSGLALLALQQSTAAMYLGVSLTSAGTGLVIPVIAFLAAGASQRSLGVTMGGLAAATALGQTLGSATSGWLFGAMVQRGFAWLSLPLLATLILLLSRPAWWTAPAALPRVHSQ